MHKSSVSLACCPQVIHRCHLSLPHPRPLKCAGVAVHIRSMLTKQYGQPGGVKSSSTAALTGVSVEQTGHLNSYIGIGRIFVYLCNAHNSTAITLDNVYIGWQIICNYAYCLCCKLLFDPTLIFYLHDCS